MLDFIKKNYKGLLLVLLYAGVAAATYTCIFLGVWSRLYAFLFGGFVFVGGLALGVLYYIYLKKDDAKEQAKKEAKLEEQVVTETKEVEEVNE